MIVQLYLATLAAACIVAGVVLVGLEIREWVKER